MCPVKKRVADRLADTGSPLEKFFLIGRIAGDKSLLHTARAHKAPFIVVAAEPYLRDVVKSAVVCDFGGIDMAVVVQNRCSFRILVI